MKGICERGDVRSRRAVAVEIDCKGAILSNVDAGVAEACSYNNRGAVMKCCLCLLLGMIFTLAASGEAGLACGAGSMTPMEARLEQLSGKGSARSTRIGNAQRAHAKMKAAVPDATAPGAGGTVTLVTKTTGCCQSKGNGCRSSGKCSKSKVICVETTCPKTTCPKSRGKSKGCAGTGVVK